MASLVISNNPQMQLLLPVHSSHFEQPGSRVPPEGWPETVGWAEGSRMQEGKHIGLSGPISALAGVRAPNVVA